jgi:hypothetical protein
LELRRTEDLPKEHIEARFGASITWPALEVDQLDTTAGLATSTSFPLQNFTPSAFIDGIVNWNNRFHVRGLGVMVLAGHGCKELSFRWVNPFSVVRFWY